MKHKQTPSQTIGPFFAHGLTAEQYGYSYFQIADGNVADYTANGEQILISGQVFDGEGSIIMDAMLEFWQCDARGKYKTQLSSPPATGFQGFGRVGTGAHKEHKFEIKTIKPGSQHRKEAPHINVIVFMRGLLNHQFTRIYFSDEKDRNEKDPVLNLVPKSRRRTLIARRKEEDGLITYHLDIHIQGRKETVFFDL